MIAAMALGFLIRPGDLALYGTWARDTMWPWQPRGLPLQAALRVVLAAAIKKAHRSGLFFKYVKLKQL